MVQKPAIGIQDFETIRAENIFYVDKTDFIKEWWDSKDAVTLITRPRRFGKTLNMSMLNCFFSSKFAGRTELFEGLSISTDEKMMALQGTYPVIFLSFASLKSNTFQGFKIQLLDLLEETYEKYPEVKMDAFIENIRKQIDTGKPVDVDSDVLSKLLSRLSRRLCSYYGKKTIILLDEYDTPMQEAYLQGYWDEMVSFLRPMFNSSFKTNDSLYRGLLTGITRVSKESFFSDFNNLEVVTTTSNRYETSFGFTEQEVFHALDQHGYSGHKEEIRAWYDGFIFGKTTDIYNPWSISNYLDKGRLETYWANTSSNSLAGKLIQEGTADVKMDMERLLAGKSICAEIDEQIVFYMLDGNVNAIWSLLLASGYLKVLNHSLPRAGQKARYELALTNLEVRIMFEGMIDGWFAQKGVGYNEFIKALLVGDKKAMNIYMNRVALSTFSYFDTGKLPSEYSEPERFYHGFVLGLMVDLQDRYEIRSNRESGFGRYDVMLVPKKSQKLPSRGQKLSPRGQKLPPRGQGLPPLTGNAMVLEFKVLDPYEEKTLEDTVQAALQQIEDMGYDEELLNRGIPRERIRHYGFAFQGKKVLIG